MHYDLRLSFYAQALAALLVSVSPGLESLILCPLGEKLQREADGVVWDPTGCFFKNFLAHANGRGPNLPFLQKLRTVRFLVDSTGTYNPYQYQPFDFYRSLNLIHSLPAIESVRVDGITHPIGIPRSSRELPSRTANYSKIEIRHSRVNDPYLTHTISTAKSLKEFTYTIGDCVKGDNSIAVVNPDDLFRSLLDYWETLEYLNLDETKALFFHEREGELRERPEDNILLRQRPPPARRSLRSFAKLRTLCLGTSLLYYFSRGFDDDQLSEEVFSFADRLPRNLESLRIYGYRKGKRLRVRGLPPHIFDDMLLQLLKGKDEKLPRLTHIAGIEELMDHTATLPPQMRPEDMRLVWQQEEDQWTEYEY